MEQAISVVLTLLYNDATLRNITFSGVDAGELIDVKDRVMDINENVPDNFKRTFVSSDGSPCMRISGAKIVSVQEEVIYNAS